MPLLERVPALPGVEAMSWIRVPDMDPGRCENHRIVWVGGNPKTLRCLDYEGTDHVCSFEKPQPVPQGTDMASAWTTISYPRPKPWVKP